MKAWTQWEVIRRQVALCGRVVDAQGKAFASAKVFIAAMPKEFKLRVDGAANAAGMDWGNLDERLDRTVSRTDGLFFFLDLPKGRYTVRGGDPKSGAEGEMAVVISWAKDGTVKRVTEDLTLQTKRRDN